jgi:hypothetical protein
VFEVVIVLSLVLGVVAAAVLPPAWLVLAGAGVTAAGLTFGVATGFWYHVALAHALAPSKALTRGWWLSPVPLHRRLDDRGRRRVLPWFYAGAVGFVVTLAGMALIALGLAASVWRTP